MYSGQSYAIYIYGFEVILHEHRLKSMPTSTDSKLVISFTHEVS